MGQGNAPLFAFNRGLIGKNGLTRTDLERSGLSAEVQTNMMPRTLGSMMLRPGFKAINRTLNDEVAILIPFVFATDDKAFIEMTPNKMRVSVDDEYLGREVVSSNIINGSFVADIDAWTDDDDANCTSQYVAGDFMGLTGTEFNSARRYQMVSLLAEDEGKAHALSIKVSRGTCLVRIGTTQNGDELLQDVRLSAGQHSITFTPSGDFYVQVEASTLYETLVDSIDIADSGFLALDTVYPAEALSAIRYDQSGDVIFVVAAGYPPQRIERRDNGSWSIVEIPNEEGPFLDPNISGTTITPSAINGNITLTASSKIFRESMGGSLFRLTSSGQTVTANVSGEVQFTNEILVSGEGSARDIRVNIDVSDSPAFDGTITVEQSIAVPGLWSDFTSYTEDADDLLINDNLDNAIVYYRIGIKSGDYTDGSADITLTNSSNSLSGTVRITEFTDQETVQAVVLRPLGGTEATSNWQEGAWSEKNGYPSSVVIYESRLWYAGNDRIDGSVSDAYSSNDPDVEGDSGSIRRNIGFGPVDRISWMLRLSRLVIGTQGAELSARSSSFDEPLTPTNFNIKDPSNQGSSFNSAAVKVDTGGFFVQRSEVRLFQIIYDPEIFDYSTRDVTVHVPEIGRPGIVRLAVQRQPDTRIHGLRADGTVAVLIFDKAENVLCWVEVKTNGFIEDVMVLPGVDEDEVYYMVRRNLGGVKRFVERWALEKDVEIHSKIYKDVTDPVLNVGTGENETDGYEDGTLLTIRSMDGEKIQQNVTVQDGEITLPSGTSEFFITQTLCPLADSYIQLDAVNSQTITGLEIFNGVEVVCWADGKDQGKHIVGNGQIVLDEIVETAVVGLGYKGRYRTTKLTYAAERGTALTQIKKVEQLGLILRHCHHKGIKFGPDFDHLDDMPDYEHGYGTLVDGFVYDQYDEEMKAFDGRWDTDSRVCLECEAPRPCTVRAMVVGMETLE